MFDPFYLDGVAPPQGFGKGFLMEFSGQPSFLTSGEMWASLDSGETQTLAAWKDGYVLRENPDGSMTAEPKFTSGIPPLTLRRVPTMGAETFASEGMDNSTWFEKSVSDSYSYANDDDDGFYPDVDYNDIDFRDDHLLDKTVTSFGYQFMDHYSILLEPNYNMAISEFTTSSNSYQGKPINFGVSLGFKYNF